MSVELGARLAGALQTEFTRRQVNTGLARIPVIHLVDTIERALSAFRSSPEQQPSAVEMFPLMPATNNLRALGDFVSVQEQQHLDSPTAIWMYDHTTRQRYKIIVPADKIALVYNHGLLTSLEVLDPWRFLLTGKAKTGDDAGLFAAESGTGGLNVTSVSTEFTDDQEVHHRIIPTRDGGLISAISQNRWEFVAVGGKSYKSSEPGVIKPGIYFGIGLNKEGKYDFENVMILRPDHLFGWGGHVNVQNKNHYLDIAYLTTPLGVDDPNAQMLWLNLLELGVDNNYHRFALLEQINRNEMEPIFNSVKTGSTKSGDLVCAFLFKDKTKGGFGIRINRVGPPFIHPGMQPVGRETISLTPDFEPTTISITPHPRLNRVILTVASTDGRIMEFEQDDKALFQPRGQIQTLGGAFQAGSPINEMVTLSTAIQPNTHVLHQGSVLSEGFSVRRLFMTLVQKASGFSDRKAGSRADTTTDNQPAIQKATSVGKLQQETDAAIISQRLQALVSCKGKNPLENSNINVLTLVTSMPGID